MIREGKGPADNPESEDPTLTDVIRDPDNWTCHEIFSNFPISTVVFQKVEEFKEYLRQKQGNLDKLGIPTTDASEPETRFTNTIHETTQELTVEVQIIDFIKYLPLEVIEMELVGAPVTINFLQAASEIELTNLQNLLVNLVNIESTYMGCLKSSQSYKSLNEQLDQLLGYAVLQLQQALMNYSNEIKIDISEYDTKMIGTNLIMQSLSVITEIITKISDNIIAPRVKEVCEKVQTYVSPSNMDTEF